MTSQYSPIPERNAKGAELDRATRSDLDNAIKDLTDKFDNKINAREMKTTEILAIYITLFTFLSVNVNIFTRVVDIQSGVWFMLIMTLCSLILVSVLFTLISHKPNVRALIILILSFIFMIVLLIATKYVPGWNVKINNS